MTIKKRAKTYDKKLTLNVGVDFQDLINVALKPQEVKPQPKAKRATGKKK